MHSYGLIVGFHQIMDRKCNEAVLNILVLSWNGAVKGCSMREKANAYYRSFQSIFV